MKQFIVPPVCLFVALVLVANADDNSANKTEAQRRPAKAARVHVSPKRPTVNPGPATNTANANGQNVKGASNRLSYSDALQRYRHERHDRDWWKRHFTTIVFVGGGYYYWDAGYWCPAWGYDQLHSYYDYDGPIYTYGNLLPDQVIFNVQRALQRLGYYAGGLTGSLGPAARTALAYYQQDAGLIVTGAIDAPTVESLGLN